MGAFENNIREKFDSAEVPMGAGAWDAFEHKLDGAQMSDLIFTQKVVNALEFALVPYAPEHWVAMHKKLDLDVEGNFESKIRGKFSKGAELLGPVVGWEDMLSKLDEAEVNDFEKSVKEKLNDGEVDYNEEHWKEMERMLDKDHKPALWALFTVGAVLAGVLVFWGVSSDDSAKFAATEYATEKSLKPVEKSNKRQLTIGVDDGVEVKREDDVVVENNKINTEPSDEVTERINSKLSKKEFETRQMRLIRAEKIKAQWNAFNNLSLKDEQKTGGKARIYSNSGMNVRARIAMSGPSKLFGESNVAENNAEDGQVKMPEMIEEEVALSEPYLDYQYTEVAYKKVASEPSLLHVGLLPWMNFWDNAAATGISGKHQISIFGSNDWKKYLRYGKQVGFEFNQPSHLLAGYEFNSERTDYAFGIYGRNTWHNNWICSDVNTSGAYQKDLGNSVFRLGIGLNYKRNQLVSEGLTLRDQVSQVASNYNETPLDDLKIEAEEYITSSVGLLLVNEHFMFTYNVGNPMMIRMNYNNEKKITHAAMGVGTLSLGSGVKLSGMAKVNVEEKITFSPGVSYSNNDKLFFLAEYEKLDRFVFTGGYQFSRLRVYTSGGYKKGRVLESSITDLFSQKGYVAVGIAYTR